MHNADHKLNKLLPNQCNIPYIMVWQLTAPSDPNSLIG